MNEDKRSLEVNLEDLAAAFDSSFDEVWHYLDLETGEVVMVTGDARQQLEALLEATDAETIEAVQEAIQNEDLADWGEGCIVYCCPCRIGIRQSLCRNSQGRFRGRL